MTIVTKLSVKYQPERLWQDCVAIVSKYGWGEVGQICLTHTPETIDATDRVFMGVGSLNGKGLKERDFSVFNEEFSGTYLEEVFHSIPFQIGRLRIMRAKPRTCYSVHRDATMRVHLPLVTNPGALMIFPDHALIIHLPRDGYAYLTDTTLRHTAMNGGLDERYHLVGALYET